jgi:hypothetical protein
MSNIAGKAYAMNVLTPMKKRQSWFNRLIFMVARVSPGTLSGLLNLSLIHFAQWVIIRKNEWPDLGQGAQTLENDYMLFCSNFNGSWDQYIDAFSDGIPQGLDLFWYCSRKYPQSIPITGFKTYIRANQIDTAYYYNATPGAAQRDIKSALRVLKAVQELEAKQAELDAEAFQREFNARLIELQNCLGAQGFAPVANTDNEAADLNRRPFTR